MSEFVDRLMLQLSNTTQLAQLLDPPGDPNHSNLRTLLSAVYDMPFATIHSIRDLQVQSIEFQRPIFLSHQASGVWTQIIPSYAQSNLSFECSERLEPVWVDLIAQLGLTLVLEIDTGEVESILTREITGFNTLDEFRARFRFIDLDAFMAQHHISTVDELKEAYHYLITEIRLRAPAPFDSNDPANQQHFTLHLAMLIRDTLDVRMLLQEAKLARVVLERTSPYQHTPESAELRTPYASVIVCPEAVLGNAPFDAGTLRSFFGQEHVLSLFVTPA